MPANDPTSQPRFAHVTPDRAIAARLARLLGAALLATCVVIIIGLVWQAATVGLVQPRPELGVFRPVDSAYRSLATTLGGVSRLDPKALMQLGVIVLIALPAARVLVLLIAMLRQRDVVYAALCAAVLAVLVYGLV